MNPFRYVNGSLHAENVALTEIASCYGTPCYVYSRQALESAFASFRAGFSDSDHLVCFAVKANPSLAILNLFARMGAGFDIVSGGELARVLAAGGDPSKVVFSGVGKTADEMRAALNAGIFCFNVESAAELDRLNQVAGEVGKRAPVSLRVNPNVDAKTHPYISTGLKNNKFGVAYEEAFELYQRAASMPNIDVHGVDCHIGSQLTTLSPFLDALDRLLLLIDRLAARGIRIDHLDLGGGLGVRYQDETPPEPSDYIQAVLEKLGSRRLKLIFEPGRSIVANAGVMLTKVEYLKPTASKNFAVIDGAMNDIIRPALYEAVMDIVPVVQPPPDRPVLNWDLVGPICESADFLGRGRALALAAGDLLAVCSAGAYCFSMSSNYNTRNRAAEVMVDGAKHTLVRRRETYADQLALESTLD